MNRLDRSINSLLETYDTHGMVNHSGGDNLPNRESIAEIVQGLDGLIFPGYRENQGLDHNKLRLITTEKVNRLARELIGEVEKSIGFALRLSQGTGRPYSEYGGAHGGCHAAAELVVEEFFEELPKIRGILMLDMEAAFRGDPAAKSADEIILSYPGFQAIAIHRLAHFFWTREVPLIPRMMSNMVHSRSGIDIHPGAEIGESFFIDHGTGIVIGETTIIGKNVKLYQGVTLGALSVKKEEAGRKRHPTIEDDVTIYANATVLGGQTIIGKGCILGGSVWITESVPPHTIIYTSAEQQKTRSL